MTFGGASGYKGKLSAVIADSHLLLDIKRVLNMFKKFLLILFAIFGLNLLLSGNSFADSNLTYTMTSIPSDRLYLCNDDDASTSVLNIKCSDYSYINITISGDAVIRFTSDYGGYSQNIGLRSGNFKFYTFDTSESSNLSIDGTWSSSVLSSGSSVIFVFSNTPIGASSPSAPSGSLSITENGTYDVTNYASAVVNVPTETIVENIEDPISNDFQKVFFAIVEKIIPAFGVLLVVWFGIDMLSSLIFGRGR